MNFLSLLPNPLDLIGTIGDTIAKGIGELGRHEQKVGQFNQTNNKPPAAVGSIATPPTPAMNAELERYHNTHQIANTVHHTSISPAQKLADVHGYKANDPFASMFTADNAMLWMTGIGLLLVFLRR